MITSVSENVTPTKYPYLGKYKSKIHEFIILFVSKGTGVVVMNVIGNTRSVGDFGTDWDEKQFELFTGSVTLKNV